MEQGPQEVRGRLNLQHRDGSAVVAEFIAIATLDENGEFAGANGSVRDMRDRDRLERDLRASEDRYRTLASSSPDMVFSTDAEGRYTFLSDRASTMLGWDLQGELGEAVLREGRAGLGRGRRSELPGGHGGTGDRPLDPDGLPRRRRCPAAARDQRPGQGRGRRHRRHQRCRARHLGAAATRARAEPLGGAVPLPRAELARHRVLDRRRGRFTFLSDAIERVTGHRAADVLGQHFSVLVDQSSGPIAGNRWTDLVADPTREQQAALVLVGPDGRRVPVDVRAIGVLDGDGEFAGIQGATRDVSDQVRLENELRRQAGELAAGEERAHLARELHDSVTQALFSMTLVSRSVEMLLEKDPAGARDQLTQLRDLQREALAEMRALIFELRPGNLEQDGLVRALQDPCRRPAGSVGAADRGRERPDGPAAVARRGGPLPHRPGGAPQRREACGGAQRARRSRARGPAVRLRVEDDGKGFDPARVPDGHLGLAGMRARAERVGAVFSCTSAPGHGTTVEVRMGAEALAALEETTGMRSAALPEVASIRDI